jgi:hypothetical protein
MSSDDIEQNLHVLLVRHENGKFSYDLNEVQSMCITLFTVIYRINYLVCQPSVKDMELQKAVQKEETVLMNSRTLPLLDMTFSETVDSLLLCCV